MATLSANFSAKLAIWLICTQPWFGSSMVWTWCFSFDVKFKPNLWSQTRFAS
jgi:hypothetical protein